MNDLISWFQLTYPNIVKEMSRSTHHYDKETLNPYHLEGDVFTHTMMVCNQLKVANRRVQLAGLLHDIGKPLSRGVNDEKKRVNFYGHEPMSAFLALDILKEYGCSKDDIVRIFKLIAMHTEPFKLSEEKLNERLCHENPKFITDLLELNKADHEGRFASLGNSVQPNIEHKEKTFTEKENTVTMLVGLPCSGKSTWFKNHDLVNNEAYISRDQIIHRLTGELNYNKAWEMADQKIVDRMLNEEIQKATRMKRDVVIDMTNLGRKSRRKRLSNFRNFNKEAVLFLTPMSEIMKRNEQREGKFIKEHVFENMMKSFYLPTLDEFDSIEYEVSL